MSNRVILSNPHGKLVAEELRAFEEKLRTELPSEYRNYLIEHNGGDFEKQIVTLSPTEGNTRVHHVYGLHQGPSYSRLDDNYRQFTINTSLFNYLPICSDSFGNKLCLKIRGRNTGAVYFVDHEKVFGFLDIHKLIYLSANFDKFIDSMKSEEESMEEFKKTNPEGYAKFQKQMKEIIEQRKRETGE